MLSTEKQRHVKNKKVTDARDRKPGRYRKIARSDYLQQSFKFIHRSLRLCFLHITFPHFPNYRLIRCAIFVTLHISIFHVI